MITQLSNQGEQTDTRLIGLSDALYENESNIDSKIGKNLSNDQREEVKILLMKYRHAIDTEDAQPIYQPPYANSYKQRKIIQEQVNEMLCNGIIEPAAGPWASPVVLVRKKNDSI